jgi:putative phosphoribosyl transferase
LIAKRRKAYGRESVSANLAGRTAIVVDDGVATGATIRVAVQGLRRQQPDRLIAAVPVASQSALAMLQAEADEVVCLRAPPHFGAVGYYYENFSEVCDEDVIALLEAADARLKTRGEGGGASPK